jgi:hypothetical protein
MVGGSRSPRMTMMVAQGQRGKTVGRAAAAADQAARDGRALRVRPRAVEGVEEMDGSIFSRQSRLVCERRGALSLSRETARYIDDE